MKVNLILHDQGPLSGYTNVYPFADDQTPGMTRGDVSNLDALVEDGEATEIVALDVIDFLPASAADDVLAGWARKLRHGGKITIGGVDIREVARRLVNQQIDPAQANAILHGPQRAPWEYRKSNLTLQLALDKMAALGLEVVRREPSQFSYLVTARRP
jgi:hypothetical protein